MHIWPTNLWQKHQEHNGEWIVCSINSVGKTEIHMKKNEIELFHSIHKNQLKIYYILKYKTWSYKTPRRKYRGKKLLVFSLDSKGWWQYLQGWCEDQELNGIYFYFVNPSKIPLSIHKQYVCQRVFEAMGSTEHSLLSLLNLVVSK